MLLPGDSIKWVTNHLGLNQIESDIACDYFKNVYDEI